MTRVCIALSLVAAMVVAGCGRRGPPEAPPIVGPTAPADPTRPDGRQVPDRDFVLDPILQ